MEQDRKAKAPEQVGVRAAAGVTSRKVRAGKARARGVGWGADKGAGRAVVRDAEVVAEGRSVTSIVISFDRRNIIMPGGDGTGPIGQGPMTGRAAGYCAGFGVPGYMNPGPGMGYGRGWGRGYGGGFGRGRGGGGGRGRGWRHGYYATGLPGWARSGWGAGAPVPPPTAWAGPPVGVPYWGQGAPFAQPDPDAERQFLEQQAEAMRAQLDQIQQRLGELAAQTAEKE